MLHALFYLLAMVGTIMTLTSIQRRRSGKAETYFRGLSPWAWTFVFLGVAVVGLVGLLSGY